MTPTELANKIVEEVFRTIEREKAIIKAEIASAIEMSFFKYMPEFLQHRGKTWGLWSDYEAAAQASNTGGFIGRGALPRQQSLPACNFYSGPHRFTPFGKDKDGLICPVGSAWNVLKEPVMRCACGAEKHEAGDWRKMVTAALDQFAQHDGPRKAYDEVQTEDGCRRYVYQTFAWQSDSPIKIARRVDALAEQMKSQGAHTIIWRVRPEISKTPDGKHLFACRLHVLPYVVLNGFKHEGDEIPEA